MSTELQSDDLIDLHGQRIVDFVGRYEVPVEDFEEACRHSGIACPKLRHDRRATDRPKDYRTYYNEATAELVACHYRQDVEALGSCYDEPTTSNLTAFGQLEKPCIRRNRTSNASSGTPKARTKREGKGV